MVLLLSLSLKLEFRFVSLYNSSNIERPTIKSETILMAGIQWDFSHTQQTPPISKPFGLGAFQNVVIDKARAY